MITIVLMAETVNTYRNGPQIMRNVYVRKSMQAFIVKSVCIKLLFTYCDIKYVSKLLIIIQESYLV